MEVVITEYAIFCGWCIPLFIGAVIYHFLPNIEREDWKF